MTFNHFNQWPATMTGAFWQTKMTEHFEGTDSWGGKKWLLIILFNDRQQWRVHFETTVLFCDGQYKKGIIWFWIHSLPRAWSFKYPSRQHHAVRSWHHHHHLHPHPQQQQVCFYLNFMTTFLNKPRLITEQR